MKREKQNIPAIQDEICYELILYDKRGGGASESNRDQTAPEM
jgi:hypothetical protein